MSTRGVSQPTRLEMVMRVRELIDGKFHGWFSTKWISSEYEKKYGEISAKQISAILFLLESEGYVHARFQSQRKRWKHESDQNNLVMPTENF